MYLIVDKPVGCVHLASRLPVGTLESILALEGGAAVQYASIAVPSIGDGRTTEPRQPSELTGVYLTGDIGC